MGRRDGGACQRRVDDPGGEAPSLGGFSHGQAFAGRVDEEDNAEYRSAMDTDVEISMWGAPLWRVACVACVSASVYDVCVFVCA
jgi:hypothetical protein